ncbi:MAG: HepT-like ribonuclease domain-containing protein [Thermoplasmatota archaeon]
MDVARAKRYRDKLALLQERQDDIATWMSDVSTYEFTQDKKLRLASYKAFQEMVEASMDLVSMMVRDSEHIVKDDYVNIGQLHDRDMLSPKTAAALKEANGLRNRLIHRYNHLRTDIAFSSMRRLLPLFTSFRQEVQSWLKQHL